jgi:SSS family solute:Na+ symporter
MAVAIFCTWGDILGIGGEGGFTFIQKYTGFISPGVFAMFLLGMFWKRTTGAAAVAGLLAGFLLSAMFNTYATAWFGHETWLYTAYPNGAGGYEIPFLVNMGWSFIFTVALMVVVSLAGPAINAKAFGLDKTMFRVKPPTLVLITMIVMAVIALYAKFW